MFGIQCVEFVLCLEEWGSTASVRSSYTYVMCNSRCYAINGYWCTDFLILYIISIEDEWELKEGVTLHLAGMSIFVDKVPSWYNLYGYVARALWIVSVAYIAYAWCPCSLNEAIGSVNIAYARELEEEILAMRKHF